MSMRPKTRRRLLIIFAVAVVLCGSLGAAYYLRKQVRQRELIARRDAGLREYAQGKYADALADLRAFLAPTANRTDPDVIFKFAMASRLTPDKTGQNLTIACQWFQNHVRMKPDAVESWRQLVVLYPVFDRYADAIYAADQVLKLAPKDIPALRAKSIYQMRLGRYDKALETARDLQAVAPDDLQNNEVILNCLKETKQTADVLKVAQKYLESHPDDARAELQMSVAYSLAEEFTPEQRAAAWKLAQKVMPMTRPTSNAARGDVYQDLRKVPADQWSRRVSAVLFAIKAKSRQAPDLAFTKLLVEQLDRLSLISQSLEVMAKVDASVDDPWVRNTVVLRLWEANRFQDVEKRLRDLKLDPASPGDIRLLAVKAITLARLGKLPEAKAIADQLASLKADKLAETWSVVLLNQSLTGAGDPIKVISSVKPFVDGQRNRAYPYLLASLGEAYAAIGEADLAIEAFSSARDADPLWFAPRLRLSRLLLSAGQPDAAMREAQLAQMILPHRITIANMLVVAAATRSAGGKLDPNVADTIIRFQKEAPGEEQTLPLYVRILIQDGKKPEAAKAIRDALAGRTPLQQTTLVELAGISQHYELGVEDACMKLAEEKYGINAGLAYSRALLLAAAGKKSEATALFEELRKKRAADESDLSWQLRWARLLEDMNDARAKATWAALGDDPANRGNLAVQKSVLAARSVHGDPDLMARTIDRLKAITGSEGASWRVAQARLLLQDRTREHVDQARKLLEETIRLVPDSVEARTLLAGVLEMDGDIAGAIKGYADVARTHPTPRILLQLARLQIQQSDFRSARDELGKVNTAELDPTQKTLAAMLFAQLGDRNHALKLVEGIDDNVADTGASLFLVNLDRLAGQNDKAEARLRGLLKDPDIRVIGAAADFYAATGRKEEAQKVLKRLDDLKVDQGLRYLVMAQYFSQWGTAAEAMGEYTDAAKASPDNIGVQVAYIGQLLKAGRLDDAMAAGEAAAKSIHDYPPLNAFLKQREPLVAMKAQGAPLALAEAILRGSPDSDAAADAISTMSKNRTATLAEMADKLRPIADRASQLAPLQIVLINQYLRLGRLDDAVSIATRTSKAIPGSLEFAKIAAQVLTQAREWNQLISVAANWRLLSPSDPAPDLLAAEAYIQLSDYASAQKQLDRYFPQATKDPAQFASVIKMQAGLMVTRGDAAQAAAMIRPYLKDKEWRGFWFGLTMSQKREPGQRAATFAMAPATAAQWLEELSKAVPADAVDEQLNLASAWVEVGKRSGDEKYTKIGTDLIDKLLAANPDKPDVTYRAALIRASQGDRKAAEAEYRKTIALEPKHAVALNNLAMLLAEDNRNLDEAAAFANQAVAAQPRFPAFLDTLAFVQGVRKDYTAALAAIQKAIDLEPSNPLWALRKIELQLDAGDKPGAAATIQRVDRMDRRLLDEDMVSRLQSLRSRATGKAVPVP